MTKAWLSRLSVLKGGAKANKPPEEPCEQDDEGDEEDEEEEEGEEGIQGSREPLSQLEGGDLNHHEIPVGLKTSSQTGLTSQIPNQDPGLQLMSIDDNVFAQHGVGVTMDVDLDQRANMLANFYTTQSPPQEGGPDPSKDNNLPDMQLRALAELAGKEGHLTGSMKYGEAVISAALYRSPDAGNNAGHSGSSFTRHRDFGVIDFGSCQNDNLDVTRRGSEELSEHLNRQRQDQNGFQPQDQIRPQQVSMLKAESSVRFASLPRQSEPASKAPSTDENHAALALEVSIPKVVTLCEPNILDRFDDHP